MHGISLRRWEAATCRFPLPREERRQQRAPSFEVETRKAGTFGGALPKPTRATARPRAPILLALGNIPAAAGTRDRAGAGRKPTRCTFGSPSGARIARTGPHRER